MSLRPIILFLVVIASGAGVIILKAEQADSQSIVYHFPGCQGHAENFQPERSSIPVTDAKIVEKFFDTLDDVSEVTDVALASFFKKENIDGAYETYTARMRQIQPHLRSFKFPAEMKLASDLILSAIEEQRQFFEAWHLALNSGDNFQNPPLSHPLAYSSSGKLHQAYGHLYLTYKSEDKCNLEAFSSHLCTLDLL